MKKYSKRGRLHLPYFFEVVAKERLFTIVMPVVGGYAHEQADYGYVPFPLRGILMPWQFRVSAESRLVTSIEVLGYIHTVPFRDFERFRNEGNH